MVRTEVSKAPGIRGQALILAIEGGRNLSIMPEFVCRTNVGKHQIRLTSACYMGNMLRMLYSALVVYVKTRL